MMRNNNDVISALNYIQTLAIAVIDSQLFLDTHPDNMEALEYFKHYSALENQAEAEFSKKYYPLSLSTAVCAKSWDEWVNSPWPWKGGNC